MKELQSERGNIELVNDELVSEEMLHYAGAMVRLLEDHSPAKWPKSLVFSEDAIRDETGDEVFGVERDGNAIISLDRVVKKASERTVRGDRLHPERIAFLMTSEAMAHELLHACFPNLGEEQIAQNAKQITHLLIEQYVVPSRVGGYVSQKLGELIITLPSDHKAKALVATNTDVDTSDATVPGTFREYIRYGLIEKAGQDISWGVPSELPTDMLIDTITNTRKEETMTETNNTYETETETEISNVEEHAADIAMEAEVPPPPADEPKVTLLNDKISYRRYIDAGWTDEKLVKAGLARWNEEPVPPPPADDEVPPPPVDDAVHTQPHATNVQVPPPPAAAAPAPSTPWKFDPTKVVEVPISPVSSLPVQQQPTGMGSLRLRPYNGHTIPADTVKQIIQQLAQMCWHHMFIGCQYVGPQPNGMRSFYFANPGYITVPMSLRPLEAIHRNANLVVRDFQVPGAEDGGFSSTMIDNHFVAAGYLSQTTRPMFKFLLDEGDGIIVQLLMFAQRPQGTDSPSSRGNVARTLAGTRMLWVRYQKGDSQGGLMFAVEDNNGDGVLSERWMKPTGVQTAMTVAAQRDAGLVQRQTAYRSAIAGTLPHFPAAPSTATVKMIDKTIPYEKYKKAGWTDAQLVKAEKAVWVQAAPTYTNVQSGSPAVPPPPMNGEEDEFPSFNQFPA